MEELLKRKEGKEKEEEICTFVHISPFWGEPVY